MNARRSDSSEVVRGLERRLRAGLAGLPRPDVDEFIDETRSHIAEQVAEGLTEAEAVAAFGNPDTVTRELVERRLWPEEGEVVPASRGRRLAAWVADVVIAWGPLVICPVWLVLIGVFVDTFLMSPEQTAQLAADYGYTPMRLSFWWVLLVAAFVAWGAFYWRRLRARSLSVGMRMAGISRLESDGKRVIVRSFDLAESEPARIVSRAKWYVGLPVAFLGIIVTFAALYYVTFAVGSIMQPWDFVGEASAQRQDLERTGPVIDEFYANVISGDVEAARSMATTDVAEDVTTLVARAQSDGVTRIEQGQNVGPNQYVVHEYVGSEAPPRTVWITVERFEEQSEPGTFATKYRITELDLDPPSLP